MAFIVVINKRNHLNINKGVVAYTISSSIKNDELALIGVAQLIVIDPKSKGCQFNSWSRAHA